MLQGLLSYDRRLLVIGKTGSGKSATGNNIFNRRVFESRLTSSSLTRVSQSHTGAVNNRSVTLIDTPDFRFSTHADFDSDSELKRSLELCSPGTHVILLLLPLSTFTQQEMDFFRWFEQTFEVDALRFTIVLFTHAETRLSRPLRETISRNDQLSDFLNRCGQRYQEFNIKARGNRQQVTELMEKVDRLVSENGNSCYTLEMMLENERRREEEKRRQKKERRKQEEEEEENRREEVQRRAEWDEREHQRTLERVRRETETRVTKECEEKLKEEKDTIRKNTDKAKKMRRYSLLKWIQLKYVCVIMVCAAAAGGISMWNKEETFMRGSFTGGSAAAAGLFVGAFWNCMWKNALLRDCSVSHDHPSDFIPLLLKIGGVLCGSFAGAVMHHFVGKNLLHVSLFAGAAGSFTAINRVLLK